MALSELEKKFCDLEKLVKKMKTENSDLMKEKKELIEKIDVLETAMLRDKDELDQEKELTKMVVDGLIKSIDTMVENENQ